jgi:transketolase
MNAEEILNDSRQISGELRLKILDMYYKAKAGHIGCSLSCIDLMIATHFFYPKGTLPPLCTPA